MTDKDPRQIAATLASRSNEIITTVRGQQHGDLAGSFSLIAEWWTSYYQHKLKAAYPAMNFALPPLDAVDVLEMMALVKKARNVYGTPIPDHTVDDIGYTSLAGGLRLQNSVNRAIEEEVANMMEKQREVHSPGTPPDEDAERGGDGTVPASGEDDEIEIPAFLREDK